ncbi:MAG: 4a-hydroxytetrahydrobiopterin dehydratase [Gammaproteobacteria bacterium]
MSELTQKHCIPCEGGVPALNQNEVAHLLSKINGWQINDDSQEIFQDFQFKTYYRTIAFVNAVAWIAQQEKHHPDIEVGYNHCKVRYSTHAVGGLTENDFICAAKIDKLLKTNE